MDLLQTFRSLAATTIQDFVTDQRQEDLQLEFKTVSDSEFKSREDRKNLAKALSGFANSAGGIVVWGIRAEKDQDGVDCARDLQMISGINKFLSRLNELTGTAVSPLVDGIEHRVFPITGSQGVAATLVPASESSPHMAKLGEDRYYKRSGDSFYKMEHFDLEDMFGRRPRPDLRLGLIPDRRAPNGTAPADLIVLARLQNVGRGAALAPYLHLKPPEPWSMCTRYSFVKWNRIEYFQWLQDDPGRLRFSGGQDAVIQPGVGRDIFQLQINEKRFEADQQDLVVEYEVGSMFSPPRTYEKVLSAPEIAALLRK